MGERGEAIIRGLAGLILLVNMILTAAGKNPIPFDQNEFIEAATYVVSAAIIGYTSWWKNNNITKEARDAQKYLDAEKIVNKNKKKRKKKI